jgi:hypothetical protein
MTDRNARVLTQIEGQHRVAAELCARGYLPSLLPERCYHCDALVIAPSGESFGIEIKANRKRSSWWCCRPPDDCHTLLWIFVELSPEAKFYLLTKDEVQTECDAYRAAAPRKATDEGFGAKQLSGHEGAWNKLPA